jgi:hypothetical protein
MKRKRKILVTPEEQAAQEEHLRELEERIRLVGVELEAAGSVYAMVPRDEGLSFAIARLEAEFAAKKKTA